MAVHGGGLSLNVSELSKDQLYDIMSQMKTLTEQNPDQARQILIQNPQLTRALFQAQILLGMVKPAQSIPNTPPTLSQHTQQSVQPPQQKNAKAASTGPAQIVLQEHSSPLEVPNPLRKSNQSMMPMSSASIPSLNSRSQPLPSNPLQSIQQPKGHLNTQATAISLPQSSQIPNVPAPPPHSSSQKPSIRQPPMPVGSVQTQLKRTDVSHMQMQPPLPPQPRPASIPAFGNQLSAQMGHNVGFQHSDSPQMHPQPTFPSGQKQKGSMGSSFSQGRPPFQTQPPNQSLYQGGGSPLGIDFNQVGNSMEAELGANCIPGLGESTTVTQQIPGPSHFIAGQMGPSTQPLQEQTITPDMEKVLLDQVMNLTPDRINLLAPEHKNLVLQLQQMIRHQ